MEASLTSTLEASPDARAVWRVDLSSVLGREYVPFVQDVIRMVCIQVSIQLLYHLGAPAGTPFFSSDFVMLIVYVVLGVMLYWLVLRKLVAVT